MQEDGPRSASSSTTPLELDLDAVEEAVEPAFEATLVERHLGVKYAATVSSQTPLRLHQKYTVKFRVGNGKSVERLVKLFAPGEHG